MLELLLHLVDHLLLLVLLFDNSLVDEQHYLVQLSLLGVEVANFGVWRIARRVRSLTVSTVPTRISWSPYMAGSKKTSALAG